MLNRFRTLAAAALVAGWALLPTSVGNAQEDFEGIVRVSDCAPGELSNSGPQAGLGRFSGCPNGNCPNAGGCPYGCRGGNCPHGSMGSCPYGCPHGRCSHGYGHGCPGGCGIAGCPVCDALHNRLYCALSWFNHGPPCTYSPDHGWAPPGRVPHRRVDVTYGKYYPNCWMGLPPEAGAARAPLVYMPTDTTQLGYYYQKAPYWLPNPHMIPPTPNPTEWHVPLCGPHGANCPPGGVTVDSQLTPGSTNETETETDTPNVAPDTPPADPADSDVPPAPAPPATDLEKSANLPQLVPVPQ